MGNCAKFVFPRRNKTLTKLNICNVAESCILRLEGYMLWLEDTPMERVGVGVGGESGGQLLHPRSLKARKTRQKRRLAASSSSAGTIAGRTRPAVPCFQ